MATAGVHTHDGDDSLEIKVFRQHYDQLVSAIQDPESLADRLFSRKVIEMSLLQEMQLFSLTKTQKNRTLLLAIYNQLKCNCCKFSEVEKALEGDSTLKSVVEKLRISLAAAHKPQLADLETELRPVHGWVQLGLCLDLPNHTLEEIHATHSSGFDTLGKCKAKMLATWLERCKNPTWSTIIAALQATGKWAIAIKISIKYGAEMPAKVLPKGKIPPQIESLDLEVHKRAKLAPLREEIERIHIELHQTEKDVEQNEKELQMLQNELQSLRNPQQSMERYTGLLLKDKQIQQLELANRREKLRELELHVRQLQHGKTPIPEDVRQKLQQTQESTASFEHEFSQLESKIKLTEETMSSELAKQRQQMSSKVDAIAHELKDLQHQNEQLQKKMQKCELELDTCLLGRSTNTQSIPDKEVAYYNIMMCAGRVEVKLWQSEIEDYDKKLQEKQTEIGSLKETLEQKQQKMKELEQRITKAEKIGASSSGYAYAYSHLESVNEMESYATKQLISKLQTETLNYKMRCTVAESQKCTLETEKQALLQEVATLRTVQTMLQQKIEKPTPKPRPGLRNTQPSLKKAPAHQKPIIAESQLLNSQFQLKWRRTADLPLAMGRPHIVQINNTTYCGGGLTGGDDGDRQVFQYSNERNEWSALPPCPTRNHALVELNEKLISIGGIEHDDPLDIPTNSVYVLEDLQWRKTMPQLATARCYASAITYDSHAIVCGGVTSWTSSDQYTCTSTVEVYSSDTNQWTMSSPLPFALCTMSTAIVNDMCYVIGGEQQEASDNVAACAPLPVLTRSAKSHQAGTSQPSPSSAVWEVLPNCPRYASTAAQLGGCVLALGGANPATVGSTDAKLYSRSSNCWRRVTGAKLPIASYHAATTTLPSGDIMLIGGLQKPGSCLNTVYIASIHSTSQ